MNFFSRPFLIAVGVAIIKFLIPLFAIHAEYQLHRDEYLYLAEGRHLAWGFDEVPPAIPFLGWVSFHLGNSINAVRLWGGIFGALTALLLGAIVNRLGGKWLAQILAGFAFLFSSYLRIHILFQPNFLDIFFWSLISYSLISFFVTEKSKWLYVAGTALGLGVLSKYMIVVFAFSLFIGILFTRQRRLLLNKHLWFAMILAFLIALPNLIWQIVNDFPAIHHVQELQQTQLQFISPMSFLIGQVLMMVNSFPLWIVGVFALALAAYNQSLRFFAWAYLIMLFIFYFTGGKDYYTLGFYPLLFSAGGVWFEKGGQLRSYFGYALVALIVGVGVLIMPIALPLLSPQEQASFGKRRHLEQFGELTWEDGKIHPLCQDFADMLGWEELAKKTSAIYNNLPDSIQKKTAIYCYNYGEAGALWFYQKKYPMPPPLSESSSFKLWFPAGIPDVSSVIIITDNNKPPESDGRFELSEIELMDSVSNPLAREYRSKIYFVGSLKYLGK